MRPPQSVIDELHLKFQQPTCPDCAAHIGQEHLGGCDVERCTVCQRQRITCNCIGHKPDQATWSGLWPGYVEAIELGLFAYLVKGLGWIPCSYENPDASPDLNRLYMSRDR